MKRKLPLILLLVLGIVFNTIFYDIMNVTNELLFIPNVYAHSFTPNNYAKFVSSLDEFQVESKLAYDNFIDGNSSLAERHAAEAYSIFTWDLMTEAEERDKKVSDEIKAAIENLQNLSSSNSKLSSITLQDFNQQEQIEKASQQMRVIDSNTKFMINATESQQQTEDSNPLNQFVTLLTNIFAGQEDSKDTAIHPMRFVEIVDSILRNYGDAYDVDYDMTDMSYMTNMNNDLSMTMNNESTSSDQNRIDSPENAANYQNAIGLSEKLSEIFENELNPVMSTNGTSELGISLAEGIKQLSSLIKDKASPKDIMMTVHLQIHPNLIKAFNLQILSDEENT